MSDDVVRFEVDGRVAIVTINRPATRNAVNGAVAEGIEAAIDRIETDADIWAGVLTADGPVFCSGADLKEVTVGRLAAISTKRGGFAGIVTRRRDKPLIVAVDGPALAGGCEIVLACDLVVASHRASFGIPEVKRSLIAAAGGLFRLPRALPKNIALELALTGDPLDAERAHAHGLVNRLVEPGEALAEAKRLAERICANAPLAVQASRRVLLGALERDDESCWSASTDEFRGVRQTEDYRDAGRAFAERRNPVWTGT